MRLFIFDGERKKPSKCFPQSRSPTSGRTCRPTSSVSVRNVLPTLFTPSARSENTHSDTLIYAVTLVQRMQTDMGLQPGSRYALHICVRSIWNASFFLKTVLISHKLHFDIKVVWIVSLALLFPRNGLGWIGSWPECSWLWRITPLLKQPG